MQGNNAIFILIGTNEGDRSTNLAAARREIAAHAGEITLTSGIYQTAAWGNTDQPDFFNQALRLTSMLAPEALLNVLLRIENDLGRFRGEKWGPRIIDIDIVLYGDEIVDTPHLTIPHNQMQLRRFVLEPLCAIAPMQIHPLLKKEIRTLLAECPDELPVRLIL